jgi:hypothetical protein
MWLHVGSGKSCEEASRTLGEERSRNGRARVLARQGGRTADGAEPSTAGRTASTGLASSAGRTSPDRHGRLWGAADRVRALATRLQVGDVGLE